MILPTATYVATAESVANVGARPVFADVDEDTLGIDPTSVEAVVTSRTAAVIGVHLYGQPADLDTLNQICSRHQLALIEDAAQAHGARWRGKRIGSFGHVACFSFYPSKNLGAMGDGGAVVTSDEDLARRIRQRANHGVGISGTHDVVGRNSRLDGIQAAILDIKLDHLDAWNERRRAAASAYQHGLGESVRSLVIDDRGEPVWHLFPIFPDDRDSLARSLSDRGVQTGVHYRQTCHEWEGFESVSLPIAERAFSRELSLPMHAFISDTDVATVCEAVHDAIGRPPEG